MTKIEWTDEVWNPVTGCSKVSEGCRNCYAERMAKRLKAMGQPLYKNGFKVTCHRKVLEKPLHWKKPRKIFVNSMSDLFHHDVPVQFIIDCFLIMGKTKQHTYQILTKRADRMLSFFEDCMSMPPIFPLQNVWLGISAEDQESYTQRVGRLIYVPAAIRFVSIEPMLGEIDLRFKYLKDHNINLINWIVCGGESGPNARPIHPDWVKSLRDQCKVAGVPFFFKQWGEWIGSDYEEETCVDTYGVMKAENGIDYCCPLEGKYADRPGRFHIKQHLWDDGMRSLRVGKKEAGHLLDGKEYREFPCR